MSIQAKLIPSIALTAGCALLTALAAADGPSSGTVVGRTAFEKRCTGCHALDHEKSGPRLAGVIGRKAGSISTFPYSAALKKSGVVWNEAAVDKWLTDPETVISDADMTFRLESSLERAAIIAYLKDTGK